MYKLPKLIENDNPLINGGVSYVYITSNSINLGWKLSSKNISAQDSIPANTLNPLYNDVSSVITFETNSQNNHIHFNQNESEKCAWVVYNDDPPNEQFNPKYGHTKGVVVANEKQGFWLIHSVPKFPPPPNTGQKVSKRLKNTIISDGKYDYPISGTRYGQSFLCISLNSDQLDIVGKQLMYNQIIVYKKNFPENLTSLYPVFANATNQIRIKTAPFTNKAVIKSLGSMEFISFAKSDKWGKGKGY